MQNDAGWIARSAIYEVFVRSFSPDGTLRGVLEGLDRIAATGANVVWLMPVHPTGVRERKGTLGSPYAIRDYRAVHPDFGTHDDLRALVQAVHDRGMMLILDWVPNHTAWDHPWTDRHPEFYTRDAHGRIRHPHDNDGNPTDWTDVAELDYGHPGLRRAMVAEMQHWLRDFGVDGFRVDMAGRVPDAFWREAVPALRAAGARLLLAEWGDARMHALGFDLTYSWDAYGRLKAVWRGEPAHTFVAAEVAGLAALPPGALRMRFTTNHDETAWDAPPVALFGGAAGARAAFVATALLPGPPLLYNGQEVESPQRLPLFEREPVEWDRPGADAARAFYRRVVDLSRTHPAFDGAAVQPVRTDAADDVVAYRRGSAVVLVNVRPRALSVTVADPSLDGTRDLLTGTPHVSGAVPLPAYGAVVLAPAG